MVDWQLDLYNDTDDQMKRTITPFRIPDATTCSIAVPSRSDA